MFSYAFKNLDPKKWFDRMHPQTLAIAMFLLYIDGSFAVVALLDKSGEIGFLRLLGGLNLLFALCMVVAYIGGAFLMANGKRLGWIIAVAASFSPFIARQLITLSTNYEDTTWVLTGGDTIGFLFDAALVALLLHSMTQQYVKRWLR
jgi:hypothetical protein